jgi:glutamate racemase
LTVLHALKRHLPQESTVYLGDTARVPYGARSAATVVKYSLNNARTLAREAQLKLLVVACNTASAVALPALEEDLAVPVIGVIEPGARAAHRASKGGSIVVLGTQGTVRSGAYPRALASLGRDHGIVTRACPLLVPLVEEGWTEGEIPGLVVRRYLHDLPMDLDTVVMGCTHYPLLRSVLRDALAPHVTLVDGAEATAEEVRALLAKDDALAAPTAHAKHRLLVTDAPEQMARLSPAFLGEVVNASDVELIDVQMTA